LALAAVAEIEWAASDVSMDQLIRAFTATGGKSAVRTDKPKATKGKSQAKKGSVVLEDVGSRWRESGREFLCIRCPGRNQLRARKVDRIWVMSRRRLPVTEIGSARV
jgi:hypothetical protein